MIQLRKAGFVADKEDVARLQREFEQTHLVRLSSLLDKELLSLALSCIEQGRWLENIVSGNISYSEYLLENGAAVNLLMLVTNGSGFLKTISEITHCDMLTLFEGRVYKMEPNIAHAKKWHNDVVDGRLIGMSLNLSPRGYHGGLFQMRGKDSDRLLVELANTGAGDAILFRLSDDLRHRVTDVQEGEPKVSFAGWFSAKRSMKDVMRHEKLARTMKT
jgi:hypothetical protein